MAGTKTEDRVEYEARVYQAERLISQADEIVRVPIKVTPDKFKAAQRLFVHGAGLLRQMNHQTVITAHIVQLEKQLGPEYGVVQLGRTTFAAVQLLKIELELI